MSEEHTKAGIRNNPGTSDGKPLGSVLPVNQPGVTDKNYHPQRKKLNDDAAKVEEELSITSKEQATHNLARVIGEIAIVGVLGKEFLTTEERSRYSTAIRQVADKLETK
jgi:hypothetical protein